MGGNEIQAEVAGLFAMGVEGNTQCLLNNFINILKRIDNRINKM